MWWVPSSSTGSAKGAVQVLFLQQMLFQLVAELGTWCFTASRFFQKTIWVIMQGLTLLHTSFMAYSKAGVPKNLALIKAGVFDCFFCEGKALSMHFLVQ